MHKNIRRFLAVAIFIMVLVPCVVFAANATPAPSPAVTPAPSPTVPPNFRLITNMTLRTNSGEIGVPFDLSEHAVISPGRGGATVPTYSDIIWTVTNVLNTWGSNIDASIAAGSSILTTSGSGQGQIRVRARVPDGAAPGRDFIRDFTLVFSSTVIHAELVGAFELFVGVPVNAQVVFSLEDGYFVDDIYPQDFFVGNLPSGLTLEPAERIDNSTVSVRIYGYPTFQSRMGWRITVPNTINPRNVRSATISVPVIRDDLYFPAITQSSTLSPRQFTFDLNPQGAMHRDVSVNLNMRDFTLRFLRYGDVTLVEGRDFTRHNQYHFTIHRSLLERLPIGEWDLTFHMNQGANPTLTMNIIDTQIYTVPFEYPTEPGPVPPPAPPQPNEDFIFLTGGVAVDTNSLLWDLNRARVSPQIQDGVATVSVRAHVLDYLSWRRPGASFEILTPMARVRIPVDFLDNIWTGRAEIINRRLSYNDVEIRITLRDLSGDERINQMFTSVYPDGEFLAPVLDFTVELVNTITNEVILTAVEFMRPVQITFTMMNNAAHLRPAGVLFARAWLEFVPSRGLTPNEFTAATIFPGIKALVNNGLVFDDIYLTHWGFVHSYTAAFSGLVAPMENLYPDTAITRGEFAQLLAFALQLPRAGASVSGFTDVPPPNVFFDGVSRLFMAGLLGTYAPNSQFHPNAIITREEIAAIAGMALILGEPVRAPQSRPLNLAFIDATQFSIHHRQNAQATIDYGVMSGYPDGNFRPQAPATRMYALSTAIGLAQALGVLGE